MLHHSHHQFFRHPFGAVSCNEKITLRLKVWLRNPPQNVQIGFSFREQTFQREMGLVESKTREHVYQVEILAPSRPGLLHYTFSLKDKGKTWYYGNNRSGLGGRGHGSPSPPLPFQITVFEPGTVTPDWLKDAVIYQIYVDRFARSGPIQNPKPNSLLHAHWENIPFYIRDSQSEAVVRWDFFGGNLSGVMEKLSYLKELGVNVIYFNPIFTAVSNHKYDTGDYKNIDPMYGDNALFLELCQKAHKLGIHIILDGVFSHTGSDSIYFNREGNYPSLGAFQSPQSPYYSWYRFHEFPHHYDSWWGIGTLPNVEEMDPGYQEFLITGEESVIKQWMGMGVLGWRLDVADELPDDFIRTLKKEVRGQNQEAVLIGEVWEDASNKESYGEKREYLLGAELDSVTHYPLRNTVLDFFLGHQNAYQVHQVLMSLCENYPRQHFYATMNLMGSHDVPRLLTILGEAPPEASFSSEHEKGEYQLTPEGRELARCRLKALSLLQMTFPGAPCIYYGDEVGMEGYGDPFCRGTYPWGKEDEEILCWYRRLIALRRKHLALRTGSWISMPLHEDVYGYLRQIQGEEDLFGRKGEDETFLLLFHRGREEEISLSIPLEPLTGFLVDLLGEKRYVLEEGTLSLTLEPLTGLILKQEV